MSVMWAAMRGGTRHPWDLADRGVIDPSCAALPPQLLPRLLPEQLAARPGRSGSVRWFVVPDPPLVRRRLGVALRRVLPLLLAPERSHVEVAPGAPHSRVAAAVDEVGAEHAVTVADERVRAVPLVHA